MSSSAARDLLLLDGWQHRRAPGHWQGWLAQSVTDAGWTVVEPTLPAPENPDPVTWRAAVLDWLTRFPGCTVVAHGRTALFWLELAATGLDDAPRPDRVLLVAPPGAELPTGVTAGSVRELSREVPLLVFSDDDPWSVPDAGTRYGTPLDLDTVEIPGGGHLNGASGFGPWPAARQWVLDGNWPTPGSGPLETLTTLHRPVGRRLGLAVAGELPPLVTRHAEHLLRVTGHRPLRRLATIRPRVGETLTRADDVTDFVRRYGHEYTAVTVPADLRTEELEDACRAEGCHLVVVPPHLTPEMGRP